MLKGRDFPTIHGFIIMLKLVQQVRFRGRQLDGPADVGGTKIVLEMLDELEWPALEGRRPVVSSPP